MIRHRPLTALALVVLSGWLTLATACGPAPAELTEAERSGRVEALYQGYRSDFPDVPSVTVGELEALQHDATVTLVDVRPAAEREVSMIPGAISFEELEGHLDRYRDSKIVTYCTIGYRSGVYAHELRARGLDAFNLEGSILAWTHAGKPLINAQGETKRVHVYGEQWALAADGYEPVWQP